MKTLLLSLLLFVIQPSLKANAFNPETDCNPDFERFSTKCEKYWLARIPHLAKRKAKDELELRFSSGKKINLKDEGFCVCDCGMTHYYLANYYPQLDCYLIFETWFFEWDYKTNNYKYPVKDYITDHGHYFLALSSLNQEKQNITPHHSVVNSPYYKNKFLTYSSIQGSNQGINLITINKDSAEEEFEVSSEIGRFESPRWIDKNTITYTKIFQKEKLPKREVVLKFNGQQWLEEKNKQLFQIIDTRLGENLIDYCMSFPSHQILSCFRQLEAEAMTSMNNSRFEIIKIKKSKRKYLIELEDKCLLLDLDYYSALEGKELFFLDELDSNILFARVLPRGSFNYLIFNSNTGTISTYSSFPSPREFSYGICTKEDFSEKPYKTKFFKLFDCRYGQEIEWIKANGAQGENSQFINPYIHNSGIVFSVAKKDLCEIDKFILKQYRNSFVLFELEKQKKNSNKCELTYSFCRGAYNEPSCRNILKKHIDSTRK